MREGLDESWGWTSWVESANEPGCGFPLQNLPFCVFETVGGAAHIGVGIGRYVLDLYKCVDAGLLDDPAEELRDACLGESLNKLMTCGRAAASKLRRKLREALRDGEGSNSRCEFGSYLVPVGDAPFRKPVNVGDYTDFYASIHHATNVGRMFRPDQPLLANYKYVPIGYHGRASSLVVSGAPVVRPWGQIKDEATAAPSFGPTRQLDYELEVGVYVGMGNALAEPIAIDDAEQHLFGVTLVNDWSARDIQAWENQPLGPFLSKSFATTVSPWVVSMEALGPFRTALARSDGDPQQLPYLTPSCTQNAGIAMHLEVHLSTSAMRAEGLPGVRLSAGDFREMYWSFAQMVAHHTSNGCNLLAGDLIASGTVSGSERGSEGCLVEMTRRGTEPLQLQNGERRSFLEDGDEVVLSGFCEVGGLPRISLGECRGRVAAARDLRSRNL